MALALADPTLRPPRWRVSLVVAVMAGVLMAALSGTPRFYDGCLLLIGVYAGVYTVHGAISGVYWSRWGPVPNECRGRYLVYMVLSAALTLGALGVGAHGFWGAAKG